MTARNVTVYRSDRVRDLYVYIDATQTLRVLPEALLQRLGATVAVMTLALTAGRRLARANAAAVLAQIDRVGYYVQLPPEPEQLPARGTEVPER